MAAEKTDDQLDSHLSPSQPSTEEDASASVPAQSPFDPTRMIGIIKRKALIKELASAYHTECLSYCQEILELQQNKEEPFIETKAPEVPRKQGKKSSKRLKKSR